MTPILFAFLLATAPAGAERLSLPTSGPATFDIAGVQLGQTAPEVRRSLSTAGYKVVQTIANADFAQLVEQKVLLRRNDAGAVAPESRGTSVILAEGPRHETIKVQFVQLPGGSVATSIRFSISQDRQAPAPFRAQVLAKYGDASLRFGAAHLRWCTPTETNCTMAGLPRQPTFDMEHGFVNSLRLELGRDGHRTVQDRLALEVDRRLPKARRSAF